MTRRPYLAAALVCLSAPAQSQGLSESLFLDEMPVVLTASRIAQSPLEAPAPVTVIDREMILASGLTEIHDLLRLAPGFQVADWPEGQPAVTNHGLGSAYPTRLLVLVDGRSVLDPFRGSVNWQDLPLRMEDVERVEVVRGPNQASYGANAFDGVIHIFTRDPAADRGVGVYAAGGRHGLGEGYVRLGGGDGASDWRVSASARQATNFRDLRRPLYYWREDIERKTLNAHWSHRPNVTDEWGVRLGLSQGDNTVGSARITYTAPYRTTRFDSHLLHLSWRRSEDAGSEVSLHYYHLGRTEEDAYNFWASSSSAPVPYLLIDRGVEMRRDDIELQQRHAFSPALNGLWGAGLRRDEVRAPQYLYGKGWVGGYQWQLFGNLDWRVTPDWLLHAGAMVEKHYNTGTLFSPRLAANYTLAPGQALRLSAGRGYRAPNIFEAASYEAVPYGDGQIADIGYWSQGEVRPEKVDFLELGYVGRSEPLGLQWDGRLFLSRFDRLIGEQSCVLAETEITGTCPFDPPPGYARPEGFAGKEGKFGHYKAYIFGNYGSARVKGADLSLDWRHRELGRFVLAHGFILIDASADADRDAKESAPQHSTSLLWTRAWPGGVHTSVVFYRVGEFKWPKDGDVQPAYRRWDVKLAKRLGKAGSEDELALTLQSFNGEHTEFERFMVEQRAFLSLRLSW